MSRWGPDADDLERRVARGLIVQEFGGADVDALEYLAHNSRADSHELDAPDTLRIDLGDDVVWAWPDPPRGWVHRIVTPERVSEDAPLPADLLADYRERGTVERRHRYELPASDAGPRNTESEL